MHRILCADSSKSRIAIIDEKGQTEWETKIGPLHDLHLLPSGNVLFQTNWTQIVEIEPSTGKQVCSTTLGVKTATQAKRLKSRISATGKRQHDDRRKRTCSDYRSGRYRQVGQPGRAKGFQTSSASRYTPGAQTAQRQLPRMP